MGGESSGGDGVVEKLELVGSAVAEGGVSPLAVVEDLDVVEDRLASSTRVFQRRRLSSSICIEDQKLSIMALSSPSPTLPKDGMSPAERNLVAEGPRCELDAVVGVDDSAGFGAAVADRHVECVDDQGAFQGASRWTSRRSELGTRPSPPAVELAFSGGVLGDVGHPQLVGSQAVELAVHEIIGGHDPPEALDPSRGGRRSQPGSSTPTPAGS